MPRVEREEPRMEVGETLELLFVFIMIGVALSIIVAFGQWWQR